MEEPIQRGDLYRVALHGDGHRIGGPHYAVVVSDEPYNWLSTVVVVPFSSSVRPADFRPETVLRGIRTRALVEQVQVVDKRRLRERMGSLGGTTIMALIDQELKHLLALAE